MNEEEMARAVRRGMVDYHNRVAAQQAAERAYRAKNRRKGCILLLIIVGVMVIMIVGRR
ncbi:hypothetical protein [Streptomyces sp. NPDC096033]|uniref:hypothetical protein n=1 Tax=Streptomyces sp. NPDC096033 TaxID=3366071 RepID=UPI00382A910A